MPGASRAAAFNRYAYVENNPLRYTDPSGNCVFGLPCPPKKAIELAIDLASDAGGAVWVNAWEPVKDVIMDDVVPYVQEVPRKAMDAVGIEEFQILEGIPVIVAKDSGANLVNRVIWPGRDANILPGVIVSRDPIPEDSFLAYEEIAHMKKFWQNPIFFFPVYGVEMVARGAWSNWDWQWAYNTHSEEVRAQAIATTRVLRDAQARRARDRQIQRIEGLYY